MGAPADGLGIDDVTHKTTVTIVISECETTSSDVVYAAVIAASVLPVAVGAGVLWLLTRVTASALRVWSIIAIVIVALFLTAPVFLLVDFGSKIALALMHIAAASSAIVGQHWAAHRRSCTTSMA